MNFPKDLKYTKDHEWARTEGKTLVIGITDHAQSALGDVVFVDLPAVGRALKAGETFGVVESIKAVSDLYAPCAGKVVEVNAALKDDPALVNRDPYQGAWMLKIEGAAPADLMDAEAYEKYVASLK
jgi:glycine cleavage system H protein